MTRTLVHISLTPCTNESRIFKETRSLLSTDLIKRVVIIGVKYDGLSEYERLCNRGLIWRVNIRSRLLGNNFVFQFLKYIELLLNIMWKFRKVNVSLVQVHGVVALPLGVFFKLIWRSKLIYDAHELETEADGLRRFDKKILKTIELFLIYFVDMVFVVSDSIANWYRSKYKTVKPVVIHNIPNVQENNMFDSDIIRSMFQINSSDMVFIYQGGFFSGRSIEKILNTFINVKQDKHVVFMGYGPLEKKIKKYVLQYTNIHYIEPVAPNKVLQYTIGADVGLCLIENTCLSYYYSLPNKLFEYIMSGLPVIINNFPDQKNIIDKFECGWTLNNQVDLLSLVDSFDKEEVNKKKTNSRRASQFLGWHNEEPTLVSSYKKLLNINK